MSKPPNLDPLAKAIAAKKGQIKDQLNKINDTNLKILIHTMTTQIEKEKDKGQQKHLMAGVSQLLKEIQDRKLDQEAMNTVYQNIKTEWDNELKENTGKLTGKFIVSAMDAIPSKDRQAEQNGRKEAQKIKQQKGIRETFGHQFEKFFRSSNKNNLPPPKPVVQPKPPELPKDSKQERDRKPPPL